MAITLTTWRADGRPIITAQSKGGVFVETIIRTAGQGAASISYPELAGLSLAVYEVYAGSYTWAEGVNPQGIPYLNLAPLPETYHGGHTILLVFAQ